MTPEYWTKIKQIYHSVLELDKSSQKDYLEKTCAGNAELRKEVESLLSADSEAGSFIVEPVAKDVASILNSGDQLLANGETLGNYQIVSRIARGGMGEVYLARDLSLNRTIAIKTLPVTTIKQRKYVRRFKIEARAAATLNHPNVAAIYSFEEIDHKPFFVMEYVKGKTLGEFITPSGLDLRIFLEWFIPLADALAHAHEKGIVHRDIKPGNINITVDGVPKILDFGLAQINELKIEDEQPTLDLTNPGQILGTPAYMSPEQAEGKQVNYSSDIFSLGVVMYETITGVRPFQGDNYAKIVSNVLTKNPRPVSESRPEVPFLLSRLILRCLEKPRRKRIESMAEVRVILEEIQAEVEAGTTMESVNPPITKQINVSPKSVLTKSVPHSGPETHYAQNGDVNIAYQVVGEGDLDIVFVMGWISHLEYFWREPRFAAFLNRLAGFSRLILFDKRGTGLSDRVPIDQLPTLEQRMDDVRCVMEAVGSERAALIGISEGGPMCSLFAATYPEKTTALVMIGTYAKRIKDVDYPWGVSREDREEFFKIMRRDWGEAIGIEERAPSLANDEDFRNWWATYLRMGASPGAAVALTKMNAEIDVREVLPTIRVPSLVIHRDGDRCLKVEEGRFVAERIPASKYLEFGGIDHLPFVGNQDEILDEIEEFLTGIRYSKDHHRVLATVMCGKIVEPPSGSVEENDWENLLDRSGVYFRRQIELFKGREISFNKNGLLAVFDGPARAIRCASAIGNAARQFDIQVKAGLHTGECDVVGDKYSGLAVRMATEIAEESNVNEILVSRTVKDLVAGSGLGFQEYAVKSFSGTEGEWRLFNVEK